jgi:hypothetical protein
MCECVNGEPVNLIQDHLISISIITVDAASRSLNYRYSERERAINIGEISRYQIKDITENDARSEFNEECCEACDS